MKSFENNMRKDTILNTGLVAIAIVWVALAAARVPMAHDGDAAAAFARSAIGAQATDLAGTHGRTAPTATTHATGQAVS